MPIVPMKQAVEVAKPGARDDWGNTQPGVTLSYNCRAEETVETVTNQYGEEAVATVKLLFDKLADIRYDDTITYENEIGVTVARKPQRIEIIRWPSGKAAITKVYL